jgi:recombination associated protein RdgC
LAYTIATSKILCKDFNVFKNLIVYRLGGASVPDSAALEAELTKAIFVECSATQPLSMGWTAPRGEPHHPLLDIVGGHWLMQLMVEQRVVPSSVVQRHADEKAAHLEHTTGRKPGKKQMKEIKEEVLLTLLPQAFTKRGAIKVWISPKQKLLMVDVSSPAKADSVITQLVKALPGVVVTPINTVQSPSAAMSEWLTTGEPPAGFTIDRECELKSADDSQSAVRYARHPLDIDEVRQHIAAGKEPTQLALTWSSRVSMVLTDTMLIKKIAFLDGVFDGVKTKGQDEAFDANAAIATGELSRLIPDLLDALCTSSLRSLRQVGATFKPPICPICHTCWPV